MISLCFLLIIVPSLVLSGPLKPGGGGSPLDDFTTPQIINYRGYKCQEYSVQTDDGYILTMHRIPYGRGVRTPNPEVVFLQHGLEDSSASWVINYPGNAAGYLLADAGFDVWMGNSRGNNYSRNHEYMDPTSKAFWNFTFDEMVKFDLSAQINFVLEKTGRDSLYYIGHSQGALTMFAKLADEPEFARKLKAYFALGPVATVNHITGGMRIIADLDLIDTYLWIFGDGQFIAEGTIIEQTLEKEICRLFGGRFCDVLIMSLFGTDSNQLNPDLVPVYLSHMPAGTSTRNVHHWTQMVKSGRFCSYDWNDGKPVKDYDLTKIKNVPIYLYASDTDWLADPSDVKILRDRLPASVLMQSNRLSSYNHMDFLWGDRAAAEIFHPIIQTIKSRMQAE
ncbi:Hydrolase [Aphelenchoides fujianensis]|nr:Hydrolase [Aphelenchoides fujianensis]